MNDLNLNSRVGEASLLDSFKNDRHGQLVVEVSERIAELHCSNRDPQHLHRNVAHQVGEESSRDPSFDQWLREAIGDERNRQ